MKDAGRASGRPIVFALIAALAISILPRPGVQPARAATADLFFSEYVEGSSNNKALEIFNGTGATVDMLAGAYNIQVFFNGSTTAGLTIMLRSSVADGAVYVVAHALANSDILAQAHLTTSAGLWNGDDAVTLRKGTTVIDAIGVIGTDPGTEWGTGLTSTADNTLRRKPTVLAGDTNTADAFDPAAEWDGFANDTSDGLGTHTIVEGDIAPAVASTSPSDDAVNVDVASNITVTFSEPVNVTGSWFTINCGTSGTHPAVASAGPTTFTLDPDTDFAGGETCTVSIAAANVSDQDSSDPPDNPTADLAFNFTTTTACGSPAVAIHDIQGSGSTSARVGNVLEIEGVVVGDYQTSPFGFNGFHVQEEDADADADASTSEGIFVFEGASAVEVAPGDVVRVAGTVGEFGSSGLSLTQIGSVTRVLVCSGGALVTPSDVTLPFASLTFAERFEGMLVATTQGLTVSETFGLGRFGELVLSSGGRLLNPTHVVEPGDAAIAMQAANNLNRIVLDDGSNTQNNDPTLYPAGGLSASNTLRVGDTVAAGRFVLEQRFGVYRLQPVEVADIIATNTRPATPAAVGGDLKVAALNVLNYFTTLNTGPGGCGPSGTLDCRGANTTFELDRQRAKTVAEILGLDADILGLMEIQNDSGATTQDLVNALNAATAPGTYAYVNTGTIGTDAIKLAILYRPAAVTPVGAHAILDSTVDSRFRDTLNRPALAQTFDDASGGRLTVVVNHLKSKGSDCNAVGDPDEGKGQGNCNVTRTLAAEALVDWIASDPTDSGDRDVLVVGDLNSYAKEDPIDVFVGAGYTNLIDEFLGEDGYSFVFQGQTGYLDHALASPTLAAQVTGTTEWHVNADEPTVLDYNTEFKSAGHVVSLYAPTPYRSSDHDPVLVGLDLLAFDFSGYFSPVDNPPVVNNVKAGQSIPIKFGLGGNFGLDVFFGDPMASALTCDSGVPSNNVDPTSSAGGSGLAYDPATDLYTYVWKTDKGWAGQCRTLTLTFDDGTYRLARFNFRP